MSERKLFLSLVLTVGVIGNVLVILVLISYKSMRTSTNLFLLNLRCFLGNRENQFSEICSSSWSISSIADLLVLIICCPNAMVEMYMRRVRWKLLFFQKQISHLQPMLFLKRISQIRWYRIFGWWERLCASWFPLLVKTFLESNYLYFVPCFHPELTVSHTSVLTILAITVERYYAVGFIISKELEGAF